MTFSFPNPFHDLWRIDLTEDLKKIEQEMEIKRVEEIQKNKDFEWMKRSDKTYA